MRIFTHIYILKIYLDFKSCLGLLISHLCIPRSWFAGQNFWTILCTKYYTIKHIKCTFSMLVRLVEWRQQKNSCIVNCQRIPIVHMFWPFQRYRPARLDKPGRSWSRIFEKSSKFWAASFKNTSNPPYFFSRRVVWALTGVPQWFPPNCSPKMRESQQFCSLDYGSWVKLLNKSNIPQSRPK